MLLSESNYTLYRLIFRRMGSFPLSSVCKFKGIPRKVVSHEIVFPKCGGTFNLIMPIKLVM